MSDNDDIRQAKVRAAEQVIYARLRRKGLTPDQAKEMAVSGAPELARKESAMTTTTDQTGDDDNTTTCMRGYRLDESAVTTLTSTPNALRDISNNLRGYHDGLDEAIDDAEAATQTPA